MSGDPRRGTLLVVSQGMVWIIFSWRRRSYLLRVVKTTCGAVLIFLRSISDPFPTLELECDSFVRIFLDPVALWGNRCGPTLMPLRKKKAKGKRKKNMEKWAVRKTRGGRDQQQEQMTSMQSRAWLCPYSGKSNYKEGVTMHNTE